MESPAKERERDGKERPSLRTRVKTGLRRVSARLSHPGRHASEPYIVDTCSDSSNEALNFPAHSPSPSSASSSDGSTLCHDAQLARQPNKEKRTVSAARAHVRTRVTSLSRLLSTSTAIAVFPASPAAADCAATTDKERITPTHTPRKLKKRHRTASAATYVSSDYMSFSAIDAPATPPGNLHEVDALDPFLVDDADGDGSPALSPLPELPAPALATASRDLTPSHELALSSPPPASLLIAPDVNVDKSIPPPPAPVAESESSEEEEEVLPPAAHLPQLVLPTMFLPIPNVRLSFHLLWWYRSSPRAYSPHVD